jgi:hypothetical protein
MGNLRLSLYLGRIPGAAQTAGVVIVRIGFAFLLRQTAGWPPSDKAMAPTTCRQSWGARWRHANNGIPTGRSLSSGRASKRAPFRGRFAFRF